MTTSELKRISIYCPHCQKFTELTPGRIGVQTGHGQVVTNSYWVADDRKIWWIGVCNSCRQPSLVKGQGEQVFPRPGTSPSDSNIPNSIRGDLDEAKMCFVAGCFRAAAVMARRCVQNACIEKKATASTLVAQINELRSSGTITVEIAEWATVVRWIGNDAAHPGDQVVSKEEAEDCLHLAEQFLHVLFVAPAIAKARRTAQGR